MAEIAPRITTTGRTRLETIIPLATPYLVFVDPCNRCNAKCSWCPTGSGEARRYVRQQSMEFGLYEKVIADLAAMPDPIKVLRLYKDGEPLLNRKLADMVCRAGESRRFHQIDTTTNGILLARATNLANNYLDKIFVSVPQNYNGKYMLGVLRFSQQIWGHTRLYAKIIGDGLSESQQQKFLHDFSFCDYVNIEHLAPCWPQFDVKQANHEVGIYGNRLGKVSVCPYIFYSAAINSDGTVSLCFLDWQHKMLIGDLKKQSFKEIWNGEKHRWYQRTMLEGRRGEIEFCRNCGQLTHGMPDDIDRYAGELRGRI